jgi:hypothetical protein
MSRTRIIGICLIVLSVILMVFAIYQVHVNMAHVGPIAGKISSYRAPFREHGLLVVGTGIASVVSFLSGALLCAIGKS